MSAPQTERRTFALALAAALVLAACGGPGGQADTKQAPAGLEATYEVTYTNDTTVIDPSVAEAQHVSTSDDGRTFRFRTSDELRGLEAGEVAIFGGVGFGRVASVREDGDEIVVGTTEATLGDAIADGEIGWTYGVNWGELPEASFRHAAEAMARAIAEQTPAPATLAVARVDREPRITLVQDGITQGLEYSGTVQGFEVNVKLTPTAERLNIDLQAVRSLPGGTKMEASAVGWVSSFTQETFLKYEDSTPTQLTSKALGVESELELKWAAAKLGEALTEVSSFKLPVSLPIPFLVGPIPVVINVGAHLQVVPELRVDEASSGGSYKVKYRSDQGFDITGTSQSGLGNLLSSDIGVSGDTVSAGWGVVAFALGVEFPRMELSMFGTTSSFITLKTYSTSQWTPGTTLTADIPPCQFGTTSLAAYAGYSVGLFGFKLADKTEELWRTEYEKYKDDKPCTLTGD